MISDERCQKALTYLASTDEDAAELKTQVARKEYLLELARKQEFLTAEGSIEHRKALAETSKAVMDANTAYLDALLESEKVRSKRLTEALIVETWRTVAVNRRTGQIT